MSRNFVLRQGEGMKRKDKLTIYIPAQKTAIASQTQNGAASQLDNPVLNLERTWEMDLST